MDRAAEAEGREAAVSAALETANASLARVRAAVAEREAVLALAEEKIA